MTMHFKMKEIPKEDSLIEMLMRFHDNGIKISEVRGVSVSNLKKISKFRIYASHCFCAGA